MSLSLLFAPRHHRAFLSTAVLIVALFPFGPGVASARADTIGIDSGVLIYGPEGVEAVSLVGTMDSGDLLLSGVTPGVAFVTPGCSPDGGLVRCSIDGLVRFRIIGSAFDDTIDMSAVLLHLEIWGAGGNDIIFGGDLADIIFGGSGNDVVSGSYGNDLIFGDAGDDVLLGLPGDDIIIGGSGNNLLDGGGGNDELVQEGPDNGDEFVPVPLPRPEVPEPAAVILLGAGLGFRALLTRKK